MARPVPAVPNPWLPYMDGQIWEFDDAELRGMPQWIPMINQVGEICGMGRMQWYMRGKYYIRFFNQDEPRDPEDLAGWKAAR